MTKMIDTIKQLIYKSKSQPKYLTAEEAQAVSEGVKKALITMRSNSSWAQIQANAAIKLAHDCPTDNPRYAHYRRMVRLRLIMQQYLMKMETAMESISSQIELAQMSAEMGAALASATNLVNTYKRDIVHFPDFIRKFMDAIGPMNEALGGGLDKMNAMLDALNGCSLDDIYSDAQLDRLIKGETTSAQPVIPVAPAAAAAPAPAKPVTKRDLLDAIEEELGRIHGSKK